MGEQVFICAIGPGSACGGIAGRFWLGLGTMADTMVLLGWQGGGGEVGTGSRSAERSEQ